MPFDLPTNPISLLVLILTNLFGVIIVSFYIWMMADAGKKDKFVWLMAIVGIPIVGIVAYYFTEKRLEHVLAYKARRAYKKMAKNNQE